MSLNMSDSEDEVKMLKRLTKKKYDGSKEKWPKFQAYFQAYLLEKGLKYYDALAAACNPDAVKHESKELHEMEQDEKQIQAKIYGYLWKLINSCYQ